MLKKVERLQALPLMIMILTCAVFSQKSVAVLNIRSDQLESGDCISVTNHLTSELQKVEGYRILSWDDVTRMLERTAVKQTPGCDDDRCVSEIGGALGAEFIVAGDIGLQGSRYMINIRLIDISKAETVNRVSRSVKGDVGMLADLMPEMAAELLFSDPPAPSSEPATSRPSPWPRNDRLENKTSSKIFIASIPPVADVYMNGKLIGKTNVAALSVEPGTHLMRFEKNGKVVEKTMTFKVGNNPSMLVRLR